jgi:hypothetical protein
LVVAQGDLVEGHGRVLYQTGQPIAICPMVGSVGNSAVCIGATVAVSGLDADEVPGYSSESSWASPYLTVRGVWTGAGIADADFAGFEPEPDATRVNPCQPPAGGWIASIPAEEEDSARSDLISKASAEDDHYVEPWITQTVDGSTVMVVGTTEEVAAARAELTALYRFNLCVIPVEYSSKELRQVARSLATESKDWNVTISPVSDSVVLEAVVFDSHVAEAAELYGAAVTVRTTVTPAQ